MLVLRHAQYRASLPVLFSREMRRDVCDEHVDSARLAVVPELLGWEGFGWRGGHGGFFILL